MGQKSSPIALRLQTNKDFTSSWYSDKLYSNILHTQLMVDKFLPKVFTQVQTNATKTHTMYCPGVLNIYTFFTSPRQFDDKVQKKTVQLKPSNFFKQPSSFHWKFISNQLSYESFGSKLLFQLCLQKKNFTKTQNVSTTFQALRPNSTTNFNLKFYSNHLEGVFQDYCETTVYWKPLKVDKLSKSASFIAAFVAHGLENQKPVKQLFSFVQTLLKKDKNVEGFKISCSGRLQGVEMAKVESKKFGKLSLHVFSSKVDYAEARASTGFGILGVKVWICYKD